MSTTHKATLSAGLLAAIASVTLGATQVQASELGQQSTGTVGIRVTIAPLGAAVAASQTGATGLWTIQGRQGLLLTSPKSVTVGQTGDLALFSQTAEALTVRSMSSGLTIARGDYSVDRGLGRQAFRIDAKAAVADAYGSIIVIATL